MYDMHFMKPTPTHTTQPPPQYNLPHRQVLDLIGFLTVMTRSSGNASGLKALVDPDKACVGVAASTGLLIATLWLLLPGPTWRRVAAYAKWPRQVSYTMSKVLVSRGNGGGVRVQAWRTRKRTERCPNSSRGGEERPKRKQQYAHVLTRCFANSIWASVSFVYSSFSSASSYYYITSLCLYPSMGSWPTSIRVALSSSRHLDAGPTRQ